ncbi:transmembrane protein 272-like [Atheta coriaria]|uniref:transmembrane protein 272-like n=1 Tax=Dalotia coriaria TaxID=877792 RepID=UPI0031F47427
MVAQTTQNTSRPPPSYNNIAGALSPSTSNGAPPSYEEAINPNAPPPSYDSLFGRVREARKTSKGIFDFFKNVFIILLGAVGCTIILGVTIAIPICMIVMGSIYLHECPQGEYIPVYLLVGGIFGILKQLLHLSARVRERQEDRDAEHLRQSPTQALLNCFMLGWFIIGSVWVYKEFEPNYDPNKENGRYCNKSLYLFAFWLITSVYILLGTVTVCLCSLSIASIIFQPQIGGSQNDMSDGRIEW